MAKLYPPSLNGTLPAFYGTTLVVPFSMNKAVSFNEISAIAIKIKTIQSNSLVYSGLTDSFSSLQATFNLEKTFNIGQYYKVQIAYVQGSTTGYYSTVGVIKYTAEPTVEIEGLSQSRDNVNTHRYTYVGRYIANSADKLEKVYSYQFNLYDNNKKLIQTSGEQIHNSYNDTELGESYDTYNIEQDLDLNQTYYLEYIVTTLNGLKKSTSYYKIMQKQSIQPEIKANLVPTLNFENGYISLALIGEKNEAGIEYTATGSYRIMRASAEDGYKTWNEILKFSLYGEKPSKWLWKDFTVKQGVTYKYALQQYNDKITSNRLESNEIYADFEHAYLYDGKRQLKLKYNPKVASFKNNVLEQKTNTIGSKYPFIFRNGNVKYKEFSISGLISCMSDEEFLFSDEESFQGFDYSINLTGSNIQVEREFKLKVLEWLNNGEPKIFRSPGEGNYIVRLINVSMSPNDTVGRMLHTVTGTAVEIADWSYQGLESYGFIQTEDPSVKQIRWETIELDKTGIGSADNILNYQAIAVRFEGMVPGDKISLDGLEIVIGATGFYEIDLSVGAVISTVRFVGSYDNTNDSFSGVRHQGTLTYAYYSQEKNRFSSIEDIQIQDVPLMQFIGEHNILEELQNVKNQISGLYWLRATKRDIYTIYRRNGQFYISESTNSEKFADFQPWMIYQIKETGKEDTYYDSFNDVYYKSYEPYIYFNGSEWNIDLTEIYEFKTKQLEDLSNLKIGNGVMLEIAFQKQIIEYSVENYSEFQEEKSTMEKAKDKVLEAKLESDITLARNTYKMLYNQYIEDITKKLQEEEAIKGESSAE